MGDRGLNDGAKRGLKPGGGGNGRMNHLSLGENLLTAVLVVGTVASFIIDWKKNHLLSPLWHPQARFHGGLLLFMLAGTS